jgi:sugar (pentulose or hexulose) kinase
VILPGSQVGYIPFDYKKVCAAPKWDWKWQALAVREEMLPELVPPGSLLGKIIQRRRVTGLQEGTPVIAAQIKLAKRLAGCSAAYRMS